MKNTEGTVKKKVCRAAVRHKDRVGRNEVALPRGRQHTQRRAGREQNPWKERYQSQSNGNPSQKSIKCFSGVSQQASSKEVLTDSVIIMPFGAVGSPWPDTATPCSQPGGEIAALAKAAQFSPTLCTLTSIKLQALGHKPPAEQQKLESLVLS